MNEGVWGLVGIVVAIIAGAMIYLHVKSSCEERGGELVGLNAPWTCVKKDSVL